VDVEVGVAVSAGGAGELVEVGAGVDVAVEQAASSRASSRTAWARIMIIKILLVSSRLRDSIIQWSSKCSLLK
jgi:hypothetical protein